MKKGWVVSIGGVAAAAMVEARDTSTHHRIAKVASLQEKHRCFRHFISIMKTILSKHQMLRLHSVKGYEIVLFK